MAVEFNQGVDALKYAYYTTGSPAFAMGDTFSIFAWVSVAQTPGALGAWVGGPVNMPPGFGGFNTCGLKIEPNRKATCISGGNPGFEEATSTTALTLNTWYAIGGSAETSALIGNISTYVDGILEASNHDPWSGGTLEETIIGACPQNSVGAFNKPFRGCIQYFTIWRDRHLTDEEHATLASGVVPTDVHPDDIVLFVPFLDLSTADNAVYSGVSTTLSYKAYNIFGDDVLSFVDDCDDEPPVDVICPDPDYVFTFSAFNNNDFTDWSIEAEAPSSCEVVRAPADFTSYLHTFYHLQDDTTFWMDSPYTMTYLKNESRNELEPSCLFQPVWEWAESASTKKFSEELEIYKTRLGQTVVDSKNRVRGRGRALQMRYTSSTGKDFHLLGWGITVDKNTKP